MIEALQMEYLFSKNPKFGGLGPNYPIITIFGHILKNAFLSITLPKLKIRKWLIARQKRIIEAHQMEYFPLERIQNLGTGP